MLRMYTSSEDFAGSPFFLKRREGGVAVVDSHCLDELFTT